MLQVPKRPPSNQVVSEISKKVKKNTSVHESQPPSQTLYVKNINDKIHISTLKHLLYLLFLTYGDVIDIIMNYKIHSMRGQAHIIFGSQQSSIIAMRSLQGTVFFEKKLEIQYAKAPSHLLEESEDEPVNYEVAIPQSVETV